MRKTRLYKAAAMMLALVLLLGVFPYAAVAEASFLELVRGISKDACYADRMARVEDATALLEKMNDDERAEAAEEIELLRAEIADLEAVSRTAERFILLVGGIGVLVDLNEREQSLALLKNDGVYFGDTSYEGIEEALRDLRSYEEEITAAVGDCVAFMDAVNELFGADTENYDEVKPLLTEAEKYLGGLDFTYDGVREAHSTYGEIKEKTVTRERFTDEFLEMVGALDEDADWATCQNAMNKIKVYLKNEKLIPTYPGVAEAMEKIGRIEERMKELVKDANVFINEVSAIGSAENYAHALLAACKTMLTVDVTAPGAKAAKQMLDAAIAEYNQTVEGIMKDFSFL